MNQILYRKLHKHTCRNTIRIEKLLSTNNFNISLQLFIIIIIIIVVVVVVVVVDFITVVSIYLLRILHLFQICCRIRLSQGKEVHPIPNDQMACRRNLHTTGLFISPSGISEFDCATTKTDTAERSISIGRESLKVFFCARDLGVLPGSTARG